MSRHPLSAIVVILVVAAGVMQLDGPQNPQPAVPMAEPAPKIEPAQVRQPQAKTVQADVQEGSGHRGQRTNVLDNPAKFLTPLKKIDPNALNIDQNCADPRFPERSYFGPLGLESLPEKDTKQKKAKPEDLNREISQNCDLNFGACVQSPFEPYFPLYALQPKKSPPVAPAPSEVKQKSSLWLDADQDVTGLPNDGGNQSAKVTGNSNTTSGFTINGGSGTKSEKIGAPPLVAPPEMHAAPELPSEPEPQQKFEWPSPEVCVLALLGIMLCVVFIGRKQHWFR